MGIAVLPPDVNESDFGFAITAKGIRFGLGAVKNVGQGAVEGIVEVRRSGGPFRSLDDFCGRIDLQRCNKRVLESLIRCGACDAFGPRQGQLNSLDAVLATAQREQKDRESGQVGLFASMGLETEIVATPVSGPEAPRKEMLSWEKELLGIYLSEHPLQEVAARMGDVVTAYLAELKEEEDGALVTVACVVTSARKHITKEKKLMMFAQVEDLTGTVEVTIFPRTYEATAAVWNTDEILLVLGRVEKRDEAPKILVEHAVPFNDQGIRDIKRVAAETAERLAKRAKFTRPTLGNGGRAAGAGPAISPSPSSPQSVAGPSAPGQAPFAKPTELVIRFREALDYERSIAIFQRIQQVLKDFAGGATVVLELPRANGGARRVSTSFKTSVSADVAEAVEREVGRDVVEVVLPQR
jgi:DNA polymerase III alpha subunit